MLRRALVAGLAVSAAGVLAGCGGGGSGMDMDHGSGAAASAAAAVSGAAGFNDADVAFAQMMIEHHRQAVEMAGLASGRAANADVKALAAAISAAQAPEIETMSGWLAAWGRPVPEPGTTGMHGMDHGESMPGMMPGHDMAELAGATGTDFDRRFLTMMIAHHEGAVTMAEQQATRGASAEAKALAARIATDQQAEITAMRELLATL